MIITFLIVFFTLIGLMVLHEFGHFIIAKKFGVRVEEFGIGYPPRIYGKKFGETLYSLNLLPFGAFVKIPDVDGGIEDTGNFSEKPIWQRALIILGGVLSFWLISFIIFSIVFVFGAPTAIDDATKGNLVNPQVQIAGIAPGSPADKAGLKIGDSIESVKRETKSAGPNEVWDSPKDRKQEIEKVKEVQEFINNHKGEEVILTVKRGREIMDVSLTPRISPPEEEGAIGVALVRTAIKKYPLWQAPIKGIEASLETTLSIIKGWHQIIFRAVQGVPTGAQFMGPIGIFSLMTHFALMGTSYFLNFIAIISIYLAIFNILPIPAVDGGRLLFLGIEKVKGSAINQKIEQNLNVAFFTLLIILMIFVTFKDIQRLF